MVYELEVLILASLACGCQLLRRIRWVVTHPTELRATSTAVAARPPLRTEDIPFAFIYCPFSVSIDIDKK
jgi:hypothetical protein